MIAPHVLLVVYCILIVLVSLTGGWLPSVMRLSHLRMQLLLSLVGGMMIGVSTLHLLPHAAEHLDDMRWLSGAFLAGVLSMLFLLRFGHVHHHEEPADADDSNAPPHDHDHDDGGTCHSHGGETPTRHRMSWLGLFIGLALHTVFDGVALGASVLAEKDHGDGSTLVLFGLGTFLAVVLHKPLDALSITSVMKAGGWTSGKRAIVNVGFALACPAGALIFWSGTSALESAAQITGAALGFSSGAFLCIALTDLVPEAHAHSHDRLKLSGSLLLGTALAVGIEMLPGHSHEHHEHTETQHEHTETHDSQTGQHDGHDHGHSHPH